MATTMQMDGTGGRAAPSGSGDRGSFYNGHLYRGVISGYKGGEHLYAVRANGQVMTDVRDVTGPAGALLGLRTHQRIPVGTEVLVAYGSPPWIISTFASDVADAASHMTHSVTGCGYADAMSTLNPDQLPPLDTLPNDLYEGEFEVGHAHSTFLRFLLFMSSLGAGQLAKIEFHMLRDLVRVVSRNFEHFSSAGDTVIYDDGRLNMEVNGTCYDFERLGKLTAKEPKLDNVREAPEPDPTATGRWRYTMLLGHIGNLFNIWFTDPAAAAGSMIDSSDNYRSGKARAHVGQDGSILFQSCADIVLERVVRIPVPLRLKQPDDPEGVLRDEMDNLDRAFLAEWETGRGATEHHTLFQIREYSRWLSQYHSLARLHQLAEKGEEWVVPSESDTPQPTAGAGETDRGEATSATGWYRDTYATIRIMRDGSILTFDGYGNVRASGPYGIIDSSASHHRVYCAGDYSVFAGGSIFLSAKRHLELVAHLGSFIVKARTGFRALCERGTMWLRSNWSPDSDYTPDEGDPAVEVVADKALVIEARNGDALISGGTALRVETSQEEGTLEMSAPNGNLAFSARDNLHMYAPGEVRFNFGEVGALFSRWDNFTGGGWGIAGLVEVNGSDGLAANNILAGSIRAAYSIASPGGDVSNYEHDGDPILPDLESTDPALPLVYQLTSASWNFLPPEEYNGSKWVEPFTGKSDANKLYQPPTVTFLEDSDEYTLWSGTSLLDGGSTRNTPWPGETITWLAATGGERLDEPSETPAGEHDSQTALENLDFGIRALNRR